MTRGSRKFRGDALSIAGASALLTALFLLAGCLGGSGTDTENGVQPVFVTARVVTQDGEPASGVRFTVSESHTRADSMLASPVVGGDTALVTDVAGYVTFKLKQEGAYVAQGGSGDTVLFLDTLRAKIKRSGVLSGGAGSPLFRVEEPIRAVGRLHLSSGGAPDSGHIYLQGTKLSWDLKKDGTYDLGWLPPSAEKLTLRVVYWKPDSGSCVKPGNTGANPATLRLVDGEIVVDNIVKGNGCPQVLH
jgi:hypothetical protein